MSKCELCKEYGFGFDRKYNPTEFIEGRKTSKIWIVGLNPKVGQTWIDTRDVAELESFFERGKGHPYFKDFNKVSPTLYDLLGGENGVSHTDIVKCPSNSFPPRGVSNEATKTIIKNCSGYFVEQLSLWKPDLVICNGSPTCKLIKKIIIPKEELDTSYIGELEGKRIFVVLSGFIGRIDDYAKRRLGVEIEHYLKQISD